MHPDIRETIIDEGQERRSYSVTVPTDIIQSDHYSIVLPVPCDVDNRNHVTRRLRTARLTEEGWMDRNESLSALVQKAQMKLSNTARYQKIEQHFNELKRLTHEVFGAT